MGAKIRSAEPYTCAFLYGKFRLAEILSMAFEGFIAGLSAGLWKSLPKGSTQPLPAAPTFIRDNRAAGKD